MAENLQTLPRTKRRQWPYLLVLYASFVWISLYPVTLSLPSTFLLDYGNIFNIASANFSYVIISFLVYGLMYLIGFELIFWLYRFILSFKIYSFLVPADNLKTDSRVYFVLRNLIYGLFVNLCFIYPYLYSYIGFVNIVVTLLMVIFYVKHLYKTYSEPIVSHFVFRYFCYPIFIYEGLSILVSVMGVI